MRRIIDNDILTLISRLVIGSVFIYASYYKIIEPASFAKSIWYYHLIPGSLINLIALILPWVEFISGLFLIIGVNYRGSVILVNIMMLVFIIALASAVVRGISIDCGCFKASKVGTDSARESLYRDFGYMILCLQLLFSRSKKWLCCSK